ncbi:biotin/lipoyl-containing protein [Thalassoglobus sp. JC818]|uniref:biotin/lipoyl-containing protein n=1 Tax=Thalassoglobus sp. JC818 TaxID=3232136 RepID=UPI003458B8A9
MVRAQLGDETVFDDLVERIESYKWGDPTKSLKRLKSGEYSWSFFVERKPLRDETVVFHMPEMSVGSPIEVRHQPVQSGDWLTRGITTLLELENEECIIELPVEKSGVLSEWIVKVGDTVQVGDPLCKFYPHVD